MQILAYKKASTIYTLYMTLYTPREHGMRDGCLGPLPIQSWRLLADTEYNQMRWLLQEPSETDIFFLLMLLQA